MAYVLSFGFLPCVPKMLGLGLEKDLNPLSYEE